MTEITLTIDGRSVTVEKGKTVLEAARSAGIEIPTICAHEDLPHYGSCRMCIVNIEGVRGYPTSCTTPAEDGMVVRTQTEELRSLRARILELMLSGHPNSCLVCDHREDCERLRPKPTKSGRATRCGVCSNRDECEIRGMTFQLEPEYELELATIYKERAVEKYDPFMDRDYNLCVLCGRCWRICEKIHGKPAIFIINRGKNARPGTYFNKSHVESGCTFCGACVDICPTGALSDRYARWYGFPDEEVKSTCVLCAEGCPIWTQVSEFKTVANRMTGFNREKRLCAMGRFAYAQLVNSPDRLLRPLVRENGELISVDWDEAIKRAAELLTGCRGDGFAVIVSASETRETRFLYKRLAREVMKGHMINVPFGGCLDDAEPRELVADLKSGKIKSVICAGNYLDPETISLIEALVVVDFLPSPLLEAAHVALPAAVLSEVEGTFKDHLGEIKAVIKSSVAPGQARGGWRVARDLARALGGKGFDDESPRAVTPDVEKDRPPKAPKVSPRDGLDALPVRFRGHYIADAVCALESMGLPTAPRTKADQASAGGFLVVEKEEPIPNFHFLKIEAPAVASYAKPGQFVIVMTRETSERVPFTLVDWDAGEGTITLVVEEVGRSSREVAALKKGDRIAHVTGPLGLPFPIEKKGTVALGGGCYGIGAIYPIAKALKEAGNKVITTLEASSHYLLYWADKIAAVSDEFHVATKDGSEGRKGGVQEVFMDLIERGEKIDAFVAIGCTFMMRMVSEKTRDSGVPTYVALNPIMVDGTGMCGACRVSIAGDTKFACVDGPIFNGHDVDWDELFSRRGAYGVVEIEALPQDAKIKGEGGHKCHGSCSRDDHQR